MRARTPALIIAAAAGILSAADTRPSFEVATVRPVKPGEQFTFAIHADPRDERLYYHPAVLMSVVARALNVLWDQVSGPAWLTADQFMIDAKVPPNTDEPRFRLMLQRLLEERFHLTFHHATKKFPGYELVVAKGGVKSFKPAAPDPPGVSPRNAAFTGKFDKDGFPVLSPGSRSLVANMDPNMVRGAFHSTMDELAQQLGVMVQLCTGDRPLPRVVDKTGVAGTFDFKIECGRANAPEPGPSIFSALKEHGLMLVSKKVDQDFILIDRIDRVPTEN